MITFPRKPIIRTSAKGRLTAVALLMVVLLFLVTASSLKAQTVDCSGFTDVGDRMKCKHSALLDEQAKVIINLETNFGGIVSGDPDKFERLKKANTRAKNVNSRTDGKKFKSFGKKHSDNQNQNSNEADDTDLEFMKDLEDNYDDVTKNIKAANDLMNNNGGQIASMTKALLTSNAPSAMAGPLATAYDPADACKTSIDWYTITRIMVVTISKQIAVGAKGIADIAGKSCDQTIAGFNGSTICIVTETAAAVMIQIATATEGIFDVVKWGIDNTSQQCISSLSADLQETKAILGSMTSTLGTVASTSSSNNSQLVGIVTDVQNIKTKVNNLTIKVNSLSSSVNNVQLQITNLSGLMNNRFNEVNTLLNTPQGQRVDFPSK